ncbi:hypothetical protein AC578_8713 [Pseudocercospora eumusae]|uniref:ER transporter 6TM N-terminal domain-containing protein n=1 Tax=Pseudocercospora eumusae TaxID=321146 RepID=A0A139HPT0_9PEZI|nr:hypothetical protein AC578_8713 [Pseudocercospora eumusae]
MERVESRRTTSSASAGIEGPSNGVSKAPTHTGSTIEEPMESEPEQSEPNQSTFSSKLIAFWSKYGVDQRTYKTMFKSSVAPTITLAAFQAAPWANYYATLGYLSIIMTILTIVIMPRAKFIQTLLVNILLLCIGCSVSLLAMYCCVQARNGDTSSYNSSASAVAGVWLVFQIFCISVLRAKLPQYNIPCMMWAVFANVAMTYGPQWTTMAYANSFALKLFIGFLTGFGVGAGVSLLIFPLNSREVVFKGMTAYIASLRGALKANLDYMHTLEREDMFAAQPTNTIGERLPKSPEAKVFKQKMQALAALHGNVSTDMPFAKREVALGKLGPDDIQEVFRLIRGVMVPTMGLSCMADIFVRIAEDRGWDRDVDLADATLDDAHNESEKMRIEAINEWHELMRHLSQPFNQITQTIDEGLEHVRIVLQLGPKKTWKNAGKQDVEAEGADPKPGDKGFTSVFERRSIEFAESKKTMLRGWCQLHGIELPENFFEDPDRADFEAPEWMNEGMLSDPHKRLRRQLFLCLYIEFLLISAAKRTLYLIRAVEQYRDNGKLSRKRIVVPGWKRLRKWAISLFNDNEDAHGDSNDGMTSEGHRAQVYLGDAYRKRKDPEHLPPANAFERGGEVLRKIAHFFASPAAAFGLRASAATMTIAVVCYLRDTQAFYTKQRLFWAQIMVSIAMSPSAGQSLRNFFLRAGGTFLALIAAWVAWYIVDGKTGGVIVFYFLTMHIGAYIMLKYPAYIPVGVIFQITVSLMIGYELQVRKLGVERATSNGQAYYPIYELGPIRLATVCGGLFVGWIWTWFPYPITEHNQLRRQLGSALYLLANYYSVMHEIVRLRLRNETGDMTLKESPGRRLEKARNKLYAKANLTISSLRAQSQFLKFDIPIGGKFPREQYQRLINQLQSVLNFMSLVSLASYSFQELRQEGEEQHGLAWVHQFEKLIGQANYTSEQVTTILVLLSASIIGEQPLPPYVKVPEPYTLGQKLDEMDNKLLSVRHIAEPGYASFAVIQLGTRFIHDDLRRLVAGVKELVGELDFSYHIVSTTDPDREQSEETLVYTRTRTESGTTDRTRTKQD